jgi:hypothetical protein
MAPEEGKAGHIGSEASDAAQKVVIVPGRDLACEVP